ncbi:MAG: hypothetical protein DRP29_00260 [Thermodesulfobacteriota bacterium]|nr:MAG: hypothetical protein DRP29_00260 [Thermodesulfobacteriota bacterium]
MAYSYITPHRIRLEDETSGTGYLIIQKDDELLWCDASANILQVLSCVKFGTLASRPTAGKKGRLYFTTDTKELFYDNGSSWVRVVSGETGIYDADLDTYLDVEPSSDADKIVGYTAGTQILNISSAGILTFPKQSACYAYLSTDQTISAGVSTKVNLDTTLFDTQNEFDSTNNRITVNEAGKYLTVGSVQIGAGGTSTLVYCIIKVNGSTKATNKLSTARDAPHILNVATVLDLSAGDYVELYAMNYDADVIVSAGSNLTFLCVAKIA